MQIAICRLKVLLQQGHQVLFGFCRPETSVGENGSFEGAVTTAVRFQWNFLDGAADDCLCLFGIAPEIFDHHFDCDVFFVFFPAVVIGHHRKCGIGDLGFTRAFCLTEVCHSDY